MERQPIIVRPLRPDDARTFLTIHYTSVHGLGTSHYPPEVLDRWAWQFDEEGEERWVQWFVRNADNEIRLIAELDGVPSGLGVLVLQNEELRACYVRPEAARKGVGTAIVKEIERIAREQGLSRLHLHSSLNAEPFYLALGYRVVERTEHVLSSGLHMAAVKMEREFAVRS